MKEQTKAQLRAEIERLNGVVSYYRAEPYQTKLQLKAQLLSEIERLNGIVSYYRAEPYSIDYGVYLLLADLIESNKSEIMDDLNYGQISNHGAYVLNAQYDLLTKAAGCLADLPKRAENGDLVRVDNGTKSGGYA